MPEISIKEALNKAYIKVRPERAAIERFKANFVTLLDTIQAKPQESEEFLKNLVSDFLKNTWYAPGYFINTSGRYDLAVHTGKAPAAPIGVLLEAKRPGNKTEMVSRDNLNAKAMGELLLYYLRETIDNKNLELKHLIITNALEWYIFDARYFYQCFSENKELIKLYSDFKTGSLLEKDNTFFYNQIAAPYIKANEKNLNYTYFNIYDYEKIIRGSDKEADNKLIGLYKLLSPEHLLKLSLANDSNSLNQSFYTELLYIMGLTEEQENGRKIIVRNKEGKRQNASIIENIMFQLSDDITDEDILYTIAFDLSITWINRILFLKLLESQILRYQGVSRESAFLNINAIKTFNELNTLFFKVLAAEPEKREEQIKTKYKNVPYLNSSLFEKTLNEETNLLISNLQNTQIDIFSSTVLKDAKGSRRRGKTGILEYIFEFLNAYDFSSEGSEEIQEENKTLINASVLGLIFEKINGYKDGSYFTPGFITMYICRETIRSAVIQKFNAARDLNAASLVDIYNKIEDIAEANKIINSIKICDPACGSGHFLVSALNEIIAIKSELGILSDSAGRRLKNYKVEVINDELVIFDEEGEIFAYNYKNEESRRVQETIFNEKRRIIENCIFGVDINPNSVKICRLRLWIELLKNAYYTPESGYTELETLPNIDINIKCGNSLISRFNLNDAIKMSMYSVEEYKQAAAAYKNSSDRQTREKLLESIKSIKVHYSEDLLKSHRLVSEKINLEKRLGEMDIETPEMDIATEKMLESKKKHIQLLEDALSKKQKEIDDFTSGAAYRDAFEWRFEFPEVLNDEGAFTGFDAVIGNPPYIFTRNEGFTDAEKQIFYTNFKFQDYQLNTFTLFTENSYNLLKEKGTFGCIMPNNWLTISSDKKFRNFIISHTSNLTIINNLYKVFTGANVDTSILMFKKGEPGCVILMESSEPNVFTAISKQHYTYLQNKAIIHIRKQDSSIILIDKINARSCQLGTLAVVSTGLKAYQTGKGKPIQTKTDKENRIYHSKKKINKTYGKYLQGVDVKRYALTWSGEYLSYGEWLAEPRKSVRFKGPRILVRQIPSPLPYMINAVYTEDAYYNDINSMVILSDDKEYLKFILGILNSKAISFWFNKEFDKMQRNIFPQFKVNELKTFPIPKITKREQRLIITLVDKILAAKEAAMDGGRKIRSATYGADVDFTADTSALEAKIDELVYKLYAISKEEIAIIEDSKTGGRRPAGSR